MDRLAFISDDRYISEETRGDVKEAVEKHFPNLPLELLSTTSTCQQKCFWTPCAAIRQTPELFIIPGLSRIIKKIIIIFLIIFRRLSPILRPLPCSLLSSEDLSNNTFAGGYYVSAESFGDSLLEIIDRVLHGEQAEDIPDKYRREGECLPLLSGAGILQYSLSPLSRTSCLCQRT